MILTAKQQRRRASESAFRKQRKKQAKIAGRQPQRDPEYLDFIRSLACAVCILIQKTPTEAAHVGTRGLRQKCADRTTLPLCADHHRTGPYAHHVLGKRFWKHHGLDREALIASFNLAYREAE